MAESDTFPAPVYKDTVLAPLFETAKRHHAGPLMRVNRAHAVMLAERGILARDEAAAILAALGDIEAAISRLPPASTIWLYRPNSARSHSALPATISMSSIQISSRLANPSSSSGSAAAKCSIGT